MAEESVSQNFLENPDPQEKAVSEDDITPSQEQQALPDRLPQCLINGWRAYRQYRAPPTQKSPSISERFSERRGWVPSPRWVKRNLTSTWYSELVLVLFSNIGVATSSEPALFALRQPFSPGMNCW
jgi:hypothetical protein